MAHFFCRQGRGLARQLPRVFACMLLGGLLVAGLPGACTAIFAQAQAEVSAPASLADYIAALQTAQAALADPAAPRALVAARAALATVEQVALPSGEVVTLTPLLGSDGEEITPEAAAARVQMVLTQLSAAGNDDTAARLAALQRVLSGPAFAQGESPWEAFVRWLAEWLDRVLPDPTPAASGAPAAEGIGDLAAWIFGGAATVAIVLLLAYWLRGLIGGFVANAETSGEGTGTDDLPQTPAEARARAAGSADAGDYRSAVRNLYLAALLTLEQHGRVPADRSLTNREVLSGVSTDQPLRARLQPVVETFDDVWYGVHEPDAGVYHAYTRAIDDLATLAATGAQGGAAQRTQGSAGSTAQEPPP
jgi:hypothetical protein